MYKCYRRGGNFEREERGWEQASKGRESNERKKREGRKKEKTNNNNHTDAMPTQRGHTAPWEDRLLALTPSSCQTSPVGRLRTQTAETKKDSEQSC